MSLVDDFDLRNYNTRDELEELRSTIDYELETLRGYRRGCIEKLNALTDAAEEDDYE